MGYIGMYNGLFYTLKFGCRFLRPEKLRGSSEIINFACNKVQKKYVVYCR